jgi:peptidoglycan/xylan/chitin deacetylase (PgdA/CDA1 family)
MNRATISVLMYHALTDANGQCSGADPHYAVSRRTLANHLAIIRARNSMPRSLADLFDQSTPSDSEMYATALTFDDGHISNFDAAKDIANVGGSADFFINPARVGDRDYASWALLDEMAAAGMSIQSHGHTHRYFNELSEAEIYDELYRSKSTIENKLGRPVTIFAPPGGRLKPTVAAIAQGLGYRAICASNAGLWKTSGSLWRIPRFAVLHSTSDAQLTRWVSQHPAELAKIRLRQLALDSMKAVLGNARYEKWRGAALGASQTRYEDSGSPK